MESFVKSQRENVQQRIESAKSAGYRIEREGEQAYVVAPNGFKSPCWYMGLNIPEDWEQGAWEACCLHNLIPIQREIK